MKTKKRVVKSAVRFVNLDELKTDPSYQRDVLESHKKIAKDFMPEALGVPLVAQRDDGDLMLVDGLQRVSALRGMGKSKVLAEVFASRGPEHEAEVFRRVNKNRTKLTPGQLFKAMLTEGDKTAWEIKETVEQTGFTLKLGTHGGKNTKTSYKEVSCVNTMLNVVKTCGTEGLKFALTAISRSWENDPLATYNYVVAGLALFHKNQEGGVDLDRLVPRLQTTTPGKLIYSAGLGNWDKATNMAELLKTVYRKRLSGRRGQ